MPTKAKSTRPTKDAVKILYQMIEDDPEAQRLLEAARINVRISQLIYDARTAAGLTQVELAMKIGTRQPVIARLEDADYEGHSLSMLQRIAAALHLQLDIEFTPLLTHAR